MMLVSFKPWLLAFVCTSLAASQLHAQITVTLLQELGFTCDNLAAAGLDTGHTVSLLDHLASETARQSSLTSIRGDISAATLTFHDATLALADSEGEYRAKLAELETRRAELLALQNEYAAAITDLRRVTVEATLGSQQRERLLLCLRPSATSVPPEYRVLPWDANQLNELHIDYVRLQSGGIHHLSESPVLSLAEQDVRVQASRLAHLANATAIWDLLRQRAAD
jgi:hypothetical protein